jgi:Flp pilus assembly protein TadG
MITKMMRVAKKSESGSVAVEAAVLAPVIFFMFAGLVDLGLMLYQRTVVGTAADAGALYALVIVNPTVPIDATYVANIQQAVTGSYNLGFTFGSAIQATPAPSTFCGCATAGAGSFSITPASCGSSCGSGITTGTYVQVNAQSNYTPLLPWSGVMSSGAVSMAASSIVRIQ